jgi:hypothetical protein
MIGDTVLDNGLAVIAKTLSRVDICEREPKTFADIPSSSLGSVTGAFQVSAIQPCEGGRHVVVGAVEGSASRQGRPQYWALSGQSKLIATGPIDDAKAVAPGVVFRLPAFPVELLRS